jgi:hypothetical protein
LAERTGNKTIRAVLPSGRDWRVVVAFAWHAFAREVDRALGIVLRAEAPPDGLLGEVGRALAAAGDGTLTRIGLWVVAGVFAVVAWGGKSRGGDNRASGLILLATPLLLRPLVTVIALLSVAIQPIYPYGITLPIALTQDWGIAQDALALAAVIAALMPVPRFAAPRPIEVFALCLLVYSALVPHWAWHWDSHPGNEPKTLRQAVALGHWLTFDAEPVTGPMETLGTRGLGESLVVGAGTLASESAAMLGAVARGEAGPGSIRAKRVARQVVGGKEGGIYSVLAPGPSILLAPTLRIDRAINRARGVEGRVAVSVLVFCALGAWLVAALFVLVRDATGRVGLAAALSFFFALLPPSLFYFHQFYPEMLGALVLAIAFRTVSLRPEGIRLHALRLGTLLAILPWLHQKFLPVWGALLVTALLVGWRSERAKMLGQAGWKWAAWLLAPNVASLYLTALYNFAITGSVRPDALFLAWGPSGVTSARLGQGLLGLLLDSRFGILPYVPLLILAVGGLALGGARLFAPVLPAAAVYYLTVASADNWSGAVCNLGRYVMPVVPLAVALAGIAIARTAQKRGAAALVLALAAWTALIALELRADPHAANNSWLLLAKSTFADGRQYIPGLFIRTWSDAAPGLLTQLLSWALLIAGAALWMRRGAASCENHAASTQRGTEECAGASPLRVLAGVSAALLLCAFVLERLGPPATRSRPLWPGELQLDEHATLFLKGEVTIREDDAVVGPGAVELLVREFVPRLDGAAAPAGRASISLTIGGARGFAHPAGRPPVALRPSGAFITMPLSAYHVVRGRGRNAAFSRGYLWLDEQAVLRPSSMEPAALEVR